MTFGSTVAMLSAALWAVSGFIIPSWMEFGAGPDSRLELDDYGHFVVSSLLCGTIAATQTYYVVTFMALRYCYPWLIQTRAADADDAADLADLVRRGRIFLGITLSVPFIVIAAVVDINFEPWVIASLAGVGLIGCALAYFLDLTIHGDADVLAATIKPGGDPLLDTESVDSSLFGSGR